MSLFLASVYAPTADAFDASSSSRREVLAKGLATGAGILTTSSGLLVPSSPAVAAPGSDALRGSIDLPSVGLGAWAWGDSLFWG